MSAIAAPLLVALLAAAGVADADRVEVADVQPLLLAALRAPDGQAHGRLTGDLAAAITQRFQASSPLYVDVTTLHRYAQAGCARLNVLLWQEGVQLPDAAAPATQKLEVGIDYCLDGRPPTSRERAP